MKLFNILVNRDQGDDPYFVHADNITEAVCLLGGRDYEITPDEVVSVRAIPSDTPRGVIPWDRMPELWNSEQCLRCQIDL